MIVNFNFLDAYCAKLLVENDPRVVDVVDLDGRTALHLACGENNFALVMLLTLQSRCIQNAFDVTHRTPLHWAGTIYHSIAIKAHNCLAVSGHHHLVSLLLEHGASDDVRDSIGATPLHYACSKNHSQCVAALLSQPFPSDLPDTMGRHALIWAVTKGHVQTVRILLEKGIRTDAADKHGNTGT
jgi:ankyrin repeat protein